MNKWCYSLAAVSLLASLAGSAHAVTYQYRTYTPGLSAAATPAAPQATPAPVPADCPWNGGTLLNGATATAYNGTATTTAGCSAKQVTQSCSDGTLAFPTATASCVVADPSIAAVTILMHFDSDFTPAVGPSPTAVNATIDTAVSKFGGGSAYFNGTNASVTFASSGATKLGTGDFTVEGWALRDATAAQSSIFYYGNYLSEHTLAVRLASGTSLDMGMCTAGSTGCSYFTGGAVSSSAWYHWAIVRQSGNVSFYLNGVNTSVTYDASNFATAYGVRLGAGDNSTSTYAPNYFYKGHLDEVRVTIGVARYTGNFTPPTEAFPNQ